MQLTVRGWVADRQQHQHQRRQQPMGWSWPYALQVPALPGRLLKYWGRRRMQLTVCGWIAERMTWCGWELERKRQQPKGLAEPPLLKLATQLVG